MTCPTFIAALEPSDELKAAGGVLDDARLLSIVSETADVGKWWKCNLRHRQVKVAGVDVAGFVGSNFLPDRLDWTQSDVVDYVG